MRKGLFLIICLILPSAFLFFGCNNTATVLDDQIDALTSEYLMNYSPNPEDDQSVLDTLDLILEEYISGLEKPDAEDIQQIVIDPTEPGKDELFAHVNTDCNTIDEVKAIILNGLANTEEAVEFTIDNSLYSSDMLYDLIFNQICEEYMIETLGMQQYVVTTMLRITGRLVVKVEFQYLGNKYTLEQVKDIKSKTLAKAKEIAINLDLANKSEYECVYAINEYLCDNCVYPDQEPYTKESHTPYGALIQNSAVCEGYARAAQLLFEIAGLNSFYVTGDTKEGGHAWNLVEVGGEYYQLDITWNDADIPNHHYFLVTDDFMSLSRTWNRQKYPSSADKPYSK